MLDLLRLLRAAGLATIASNLLAAVAVATSQQSLREVAAQVYRAMPDGLWVIVASTAIYGAGMVWNDLADVERDRQIAPKRPLPAGRIGYGTAWVLGIILVIVAILAGAQVGWRGAYGASIVLVLALGYDLVAKHVPWLGSLVMAATRVAHAVFALLVLGPEFFDLVVVQIAGALGLVESTVTQVGFYPYLLGCYVFGVTLVSELEHRCSYRWELLVGSLVIGVALAWALGQSLFSDQAQQWWELRTMALLVLVVVASLLVAAWLAWRVGRPLVAAIRSGERRAIGPAVIGGLGGIIILDALVVVGHRPLLAPLILLLLLPFTIVGRMARMD